MSLSGSEGYDEDYESLDGGPFFQLKEEIRRGDYRAVTEALEDGANPDESHDDYTLLHWAAGNTDAHTLIEDEAKCGDQEVPIGDRRKIVEALLKYGANATAIWCQQQFATHCAQRPWDMTNDRPTKTTLYEAAVMQALEAIHFCESDEKILNGGLLAAASLNDIDAITTILKAGAYVDDDFSDTTALIKASCLGHLAASKVLIEIFGADANHEANWRGYTALWAAVRGGRLELAKYLLSKGANPFHECIGYSLITMWASTACEDGDASNRDLLIRELLHDAMLEKVLDRASNVESAYISFVAHGHIDGVEALLSLDLPLPSNVLQTAIVFGQEETLVLLLRAGALETFDSTYEEVRYYGSSKHRPTNEQVDHCQFIFDAWIVEASK